jgi:hypothetical protein
MEGIPEMLKILAEKVSRKAVVITIAMVLVYLLGAASGASNTMLCICIIAGLSLFFTVLQYIIDRNNEGRRNKKHGNIKSRTFSKEMKEVISVNSEEKVVEEDPGFKAIQEILNSDDVK